MSMWTHYDNLRVPRDATPEEIKRAYSRLVFRHHPDRAKESDKAEKTKIMQIINASYRILSNPQTRAAYDAQLRRKEDFFAEVKDEDSDGRSYTAYRPPPRNRDNVEEYYEALRRFKIRAMPIIKNILILIASVAIVLIGGIINFALRHI